MPRKPCEPLGATYYIRSVRDQLGQMQENRGISTEDNNFINLMSVILLQTSQVMYTIFSMFLALVPAGTILLHLFHFLFDRILDIIITKRPKEKVTKGAVFAVQLLIVGYCLRFAALNIMYPIFHMQTAVVTGFFGSSGKNPCCGG